MKPLRIAMVAAECHPFSKAGGLADMVPALSKALDRLHAEVTIYTPRYRSTEPADTLPGTRVRMRFVEDDALFGREGIYDDPATGEGYADNGRRFAVFAREAARRIAAEEDGGFDVAHLHDSHAALAAPLLGRVGPGAPPTVLTIHNLGYQGIYPPDEIFPAIGLPAEEHFYPMSPWEFYGMVNVLKAGIEHATALTTVSPRYAEEIRTPEFGHGLDGVLRDHARKLTGILNGIDTDTWDPAGDPLIPHRYSVDDLAGKRRNKTALLEEIGLPKTGERVPLLGMVSRLTAQKGYDLVLQALPKLVERGAQAVILGTGQEEIVRGLRDLAARHPQRISVRIGFDEGLAHRIEAGSDMFLMPSRYEPCGLNQMYSLRYGTVPVVRETGGLADTVDESNGFRFRNYSASDLLDATNAALDAYADPPGWRDRMLRGMTRDLSWGASARRYADVYRRASAAPSAG